MRHLITVFALTAVLTGGLSAPAAAAESSDGLFGLVGQLSTPLNVLL